MVLVLVLVLIDDGRDDGLAIFKNISGPKSENVKSDIQKLFKENELDIIIQCNLKTVNYLDVTLNLTKKKIIKLNG